MDSFKVSNASLRVISRSWNHADRQCHHVSFVIEEIVHGCGCEDDLAACITAMVKDLVPARRR